MVAAATPTLFDASRPIDLASPNFSEHKYEWYRWMLEEAPACMGKISIMKIGLVSRYDDCRMVLTDERFIRNRGRAKGKGSSPLPFPLPKSIAALSRSMILEDDPEHRRLRNLVNRAFTPRAVERLSDRVEGLSHELLDRLETQASFDLLENYARPIPTRVIAEMVGVPRADAEQFHKSLRMLTKGLSGFAVVRTLRWDPRGTSKFIRNLIKRKREEPGDDILSELIQAEEEGDRLREDELVAMVFLLIFAGHETTVHLITNGVVTLLQHPDQLARLRAQPELMESAVEEILRYAGPIQSTKPGYAREDVTLHGVTIPKGSAVMPLLGSANRDPRAFEDADAFRIGRDTTASLAFGRGTHFCLGANLARMEARVCLEELLRRLPRYEVAREGARRLRSTSVHGFASLILEFS